MLKYQINRDGSPFGPYEEEDAVKYFILGSIIESDLVWRAGMPDWLTAQEVFGSHATKSSVSPALPPIPPLMTGPNIPSRSDSASVYPISGKFSVDIDEKIHLEGSATYFKNTLSVISGYAFLTSKRFVFCGATSALAMSFESQKTDILFSIPLVDIKTAEEAKHVFTKKIIISTKTGIAYAVTMDPIDKWTAILTNRGLPTADEMPQNNEPDDGKFWYYEEGGKKVGPIATSVVKQMAANNHTIYRFTKVWNESLPAWVKAEETEIGKYFSGPSPLMGTDIDNTIIWILAFGPIIGSLVEIGLVEMFDTGPNKFWMVTLIFNIVLSIMDEKKLNAAGHNTRALGLGSAWIVPVYMFKRSKALKQKPAYFIVWIAMFVLSLFL